MGAVGRGQALWHGCSILVGGLAVLISSLVFLDCLVLRSLTDFILLAIGILWKTLRTPGSFIAILTLPVGVMLSTSER